jgi:ABC-type sugar transport system ATPase subunit
VLELEGVAKRYGRGDRHSVVVLRDVSLRVGMGEFVSIVGDPVSGKTTLLRIAAGLEAPDEGVVRLDGRQLPVVADLDPRIAMVANVPLPPELEHFSVRELVAAPLLSQGCSPREARGRADEALESFGIRHLARKRWEELSDFERTSVRITQGVVRKPELLLLDNPVHGLGITHSEAVLARVRDTMDPETAVLMTVGEIPASLRTDASYTLSAGILIKESQRHRGHIVDFPAGGRGG